VKDPRGTLWWITMHIENVGQEELKPRAEAAMRKAGG
jgi:hypothetical protein